MAENTEGWEPTCKRFVAFLDIMGFKDMVLRSRHDEVLRILESLTPTIQGIEEDAIKRLAKTEFNELEKTGIKFIIRPVLFSDSIILISYDGSLASAIGMSVNIRQIFHQAILNGIPVKGAIAYGEQTADFNNSLHFGMPLIDAFELQNELLLYGVILHHTMEKHLIENQMMTIFENKDIFKWPVPMKSSKINHYIYDPTPSDISQKSYINKVLHLYSTVSGIPRKYVDNTLEYAEWLVKRKPEL